MRVPTKGRLAVTVLAFTASLSHAAGPIPEGYQRVAAAHGVPSALFYAVALAESGKHIEALQSVRPWPWTLNVQGDGQFYPSRQAAVAALHRTLASGRSSVDIGLMQVNWKYHADALRSIEAAIDPYRNLDVAAAILIACYQSRGDWWAAVGCYHAPNDRHRAVRYRDRVKDIWSGLAETG